MKIDSTKYETIRYILINEWDPIGIRDIDEAQDEYDSYARHIYEMIKNNNTNDIYSFLCWVEGNHICLEVDSIANIRIAAKLSGL